METFSFRLEPNQLLKESILEFANKNNIRAGIILTCVGSLKDIKIRLANANNFLEKEAFFEILAVSGTFNNNFEGHFHISLADSQGECVGGHLLDNNKIYTTAEIVLAKIDRKVFSRKVDKSTNFKELFIENDLFR